jgi:hypothetical protein
LVLAVLAVRQERFLIVVQLEPLVALHLLVLICHLMVAVAVLVGDLVLFLVDLEAVLQGLEQLEVQALMYKAVFLALYILGLPVVETT